MAKTLSKTGITNGNTIEVSHVTQSIDALTGIDAYDITISGSLTLSDDTQMAGTASVAISSSVAVSSSYATTASFALNGGGGGTVDTGSLLNNAAKTGGRENTITFTKGDATTFNVELAAIPTSFASSTGGTFDSTPDTTGKTEAGWVDIVIGGTTYYIPVWTTS